MAKRTKLGKRFVTIKARNARVRVYGKTKRSAKANASRFISRHIRNIAEGWYTGGVFHPIRASEDYKPSRAGEGRTAKAKHIRATRATRKRALGL